MLFLENKIKHMAHLHYYGPRHLKNMHLWSENWTQFIYNELVFFLKFIFFFLAAALEVPSFPAPPHIPPAFPVFLVTDIVPYSPTPHHFLWLTQVPFSHNLTLSLHPKNMPSLAVHDKQLLNSLPNWLWPSACKIFLNEHSHIKSPQMTLSLVHLVLHLHTWHHCQHSAWHSPLWLTAGELSDLFFTKAVAKPSCPFWTC